MYNVVQSPTLHFTNISKMENNVKGGEEGRRGGNQIVSRNIPVKLNILIDSHLRKNPAKVMEMMEIHLHHPPLL